MKITNGLRMVGVAGSAAMLLIGCAVHKEESTAKATPVAKPAPGLVCPAQFGNSDAFVSVITP